MSSVINFYTPDQNPYFSAVSLWFVARIRQAPDGSDWLLPDALVTKTMDTQTFILYTSRLDALVSCLLFNRNDPAANWQVYAFGDLDIKRLVQNKQEQHFAIASGYVTDEHYRLIKNGRTFMPFFFLVTFDLRGKRLTSLNFEESLFIDINEHWLPHYPDYCKSMLEQNALSAETLQQYATDALGCAEITAVPLFTASKARLISTYSPPHNDWLVAITEKRPEIVH